MSSNSAYLLIWEREKSFLTFAKPLSSSKILVAPNGHGFCEDHMSSRFPSSRHITRHVLVVHAEWPSLPVPAGVLTESCLAFSFSSIYPQCSLNVSVLTLSAWSWQSLSMAGKMPHNLTPNSCLTFHQAPGMTQHSWDTSVLTHLFALYAQKAFSQTQLPIYTPSCPVKAHLRGKSSAIEAFTAPGELVLPSAWHSKPTAYTLHHSTYTLIASFMNWVPQHNISPWGETVFSVHFFLITTESLDMKQYGCLWDKGGGAEQLRSPAPPPDFLSFSPRLAPCWMSDFGQVT